MLIAPTAPIQSPTVLMPISADREAAAHPARVGSCMGAKLPTNRVQPASAAYNESGEAYPVSSR